MIIWKYIKSKRNDIPTISILCIETNCQNQSKNFQYLFMFSKNKHHDIFVIELHKYAETTSKST